MISESTFGKTMSYQYDTAGDRTRVTWLDAFYAQYSYDALGRVTTIGENGAVSGIGLLATFGYDDLGRRTSLTRGNGTSTTYSYDSADRPTALVQNVSGTTFDQTYGFSWSPASQLLTRTASNAAYKWATPTPGTTALAYNGLNQDSAIAAASGYDARGNLVSGRKRDTHSLSLNNKSNIDKESVSPFPAYDALRRKRFEIEGGTYTFHLPGRPPARREDVAVPTPCEPTPRSCPFLDVFPSPCVPGQVGGPEGVGPVIVDNGAYTGRLGYAHRPCGQAPARHPQRPLVQRLRNLIFWTMAHILIAWAAPTRRLRQARPGPEPRADGP